MRPGGLRAAVGRSSVGARLSARVSYASFRQKPVLRSRPTSAPVRGAARSARSRRGASAGASASGRNRSGVGSAYRRVADELPCAHDVAHALPLDDERRRRRCCRPRSRRRAAGGRRRATTETPNGAAWSRSGSGRRAPRGEALRAGSERAMRSASARESFPSSRSVTSSRCQISALRARYSSIGCGRPFPAT